MLGYLNLVKSWWPRIALVVILLLFAWYFIENIDDFKILLNVSPVYLLMVGLGYAITLIVNGLFVRTMLLAHQKEIGIFDSTLASIISAVGNFFFPVGTGALAQARFLKSKYDFNFKSFAVTLSGNYIIVFFVSSLLGILSLLALNEYGGFPSYNIVLAIFLGLFIATSFLAFLGAPEFLTRKVNEVNIKYLRRVARILSQIMDGWNFIVSRKKVLIWLVFYTVVNFLVMMMISYATIRAVGLSI